MKKGNVNIVRDHRENQKNKKISIRPNNWGVCFCADKHCAELPPDERERDSNRRIFIILCEIWQNLCCCLSVCWPNSHITNQLAILTNKSRELILLYLNYLSNDRSEFIRWLFFSLQIGSSAINIIIKSVKNSPRARKSSFLLFFPTSGCFCVYKIIELYTTRMTSSSSSSIYYTIFYRRQNVGQQLSWFCVCNVETLYKKYSIHL